MPLRFLCKDNDLVSYVKDPLAEPSAIVVRDETGFLKKRTELGGGETAVEWNSGQAQAV